MNTHGGKRENSGRPKGSKNRITEVALFRQELLSLLEHKGLSLAEAYIDLAFNAKESIVRLKALNEITMRIYGKVPDKVITEVTQGLTISELFAQEDNTDE